MQNSTKTSLGVTLNIISSALFALMFAYTSLLNELQGQETYGWRVLFTVPFLTVFILLKGYWPLVLGIYTRVRYEKYFWLTRLLSSFLVGVQLWLFMWAPVNGYGLAVSLGYFIMPITMVIIGRLAFQERLTPHQKVACLFALIAILNLLIVSQSFLWPVWVVCIGYPIYFWLRKKTNTNNIGCIWVDMLLSLPIACYFIFANGQVVTELTVNLTLLYLVVGLGGISALALSFQSLSAPYLNLSLFGLLVYVEPVLLLIVAILLGETINQKDWLTYIAILLAVVTLILEGIRKLHLTHYR